MTIIKHLKQKYYFKKLEKGSSIIESINDWEILIKQIHKNLDYIDALKDIFKTHPNIKMEMDNSIIIHRQYKMMFSFNQFLQHFINKDFEEAFYLSFGLLNTAQHQEDKHIYLQWALSCLGQIKTIYMNNDHWIQYNIRFYQVEKHLIQISEQIHHHKNINNAYISISYLKFIENDLSQSRDFLNIYTHLFDINSLINHERLFPQPLWLRETIHQDKQSLFNEFIVNYLLEK